MNIQNDLILRAARGEHTERTPVWLMRQAGRILPEYRAVRAKAKDFVEFVENPELAAEVTIQPVDILGVDAAIIFSDILVVPQAMGCPYKMLEQKGPWFEKTIRNKHDLNLLHDADPEADLGFVLEAIRLTKRALNNRVPLIGFAGAPWTIFAYMTEGSGSKTFSIAKKCLYTDPEFSHTLLSQITRSTIAYLKAQIKAGADMVQIFDSWAGVLSPQQYEIFSLNYIHQICEAITEVPVTVFGKGAYFAREAFGNLPCNTIGLDWNMDIKESRRLIGNSKTLQGNMDPCMLYASASEIKKQTEIMLKAFGPQRYIANLGHGLYPDIHPDNVKIFIETIKLYNHQPHN
jgi:uroporphyrinogen decarboxylase